MIPHTYGRPRWALAAGLAALALTAAGCASASGSPAASTGTQAASTSSGAAAGTTGVSQVTLHIGDQAGSGAEALLTAAGLINKLPFKVSWSDFTSGPPMLQAMGAGSVDVGSVGDSPPVFAAAGGDKIAAVGALKANPLEDALLVPRTSSIRTLAQLRGKRIAVAQGSASDYHLLTVLRKAGLTVHDVTLIYLQPAEGLAALASGHVDAWDIWSPFTDQAEVQDHARVLVTGGAYGSPYSFTMASRAALASPAKAAAIGDYVKLLGEAYAWASTHHAAWAAIWAKATGLPLAIMTRAAQDSSTTETPLTPAVISSEQQVSNAFSTAGLIPGQVNFSGFVAAAFTAPAGGSSS